MSVRGVPPRVPLTPAEQAEVNDLVCPVCRVRLYLSGICPLCRVAWRAAPVEEVEE